MAWDSEAQKEREGGSINKRCFFPSVVWQMTAQLRPAAADSPQLKQQQRLRGKETATKWDRPRENKNGDGQEQVDVEEKIPDSKGGTKNLDEDGGREREKGR